MEVKRSSNKSFGIVFFIVFILIGCWPLLDINTYRLWAIIIAIIFLTLGIMNSRLLTPFNILWFKFGNFLGKIVSPIIMGVIFFFVGPRLPVVAVQGNCPVQPPLGDSICTFGAHLGSKSFCSGCRQEESQEGEREEGRKNSPNYVVDPKNWKIKKK